MGLLVYLALMVPFFAVTAYVASLCHQPETSKTSWKVKALNGLLALLAFSIASVAAIAVTLYLGFDLTFGYEGDGDRPGSGPFEW
jgi:hypothetical protein